MIGVAVLVILNGGVVASAPPSLLIDGHVMSPVTSVAARIATRVSMDDGTIIVERGTLRCTLRTNVASIVCDGSAPVAAPAPFVSGHITYVPIASLARAFAGGAVFDATSKTLALVLAPDTTIMTPMPYDPAAPRAAPTMIFTPEPPSPTPHTKETGAPRPRRTAIPAIPSQPQVPGGFRGANVR